MTCGISVLRNDRKCKYMFIFPENQFNTVRVNHSYYCKTYYWRHNESDFVSNHRRLDCLLSRLFRHRSTKTSKLHVSGLCEGSPADSTHKGPVKWKTFPYHHVLTAIFYIPSGLVVVMCWSTGSIFPEKINLRLTKPTMKFSGHLA